MAYNVLTDFGANNLVADGVTNNSTKYANIVASLTAPYTLYFPTGTYIFGSTMTIAAGGVKIYGDGKNQTLLKGTRASAGGGAAVTAATKCELADLHITTTDDAHSCDQCLDITSKTAVTLTRVKFSNGFSAGIRAAALSQVFCYGCEWTNIYQEASASGVSGGVFNAIFDGCWFHDMNQTQTTNHGIYINAPNSVNIPIAITISNCLFEAWGPAIPIALKGDEVDDVNAQALVVTGCTFSGDHLGGGAIILNHASATTVTNNAFYECDGLSAFASQNVVFSNNVQYDDRSLGYYLVAFSGCNFVSITGNAVSSPVGSVVYSSGVTLYDTTDVVIQDNVFTGIMLPVRLQASTANATTRVTVRNNKFGQPVAWPLIGGNYYFGLPGIYYGVAVDGACSKLTVLDNDCQNVNYELFFTIFSGAGQANSVRFRSASWDVPVSSYLGYSGGAVPTAVVQYTHGEVPVQTVATALTGITTLGR